MKTRELLTTPETLLVPRLRTLKLKELERHAQKLIERKGGADYRKVLAATTKAIPQLKENGVDRFIEIQKVVANLLDNQLIQTEEDEKIIIPRIAVLLSVIIAKQFDRIHNSGKGATK